MYKKIRMTLLTVLLLIPFTGLYAAEFDRFGSFDFPTSGTGEAQRHFLLGVGYLHSFGMTQAQATA